MKHKTHAIAYQVNVRRKHCVPFNFCIMKIHIG